jgi:hypothetical protein
MNGKEQPESDRHTSRDEDGWRESYDRYSIARGTNRQEVISVEERKGTEVYFYTLSDATIYQIL